MQSKLSILLDTLFLSVIAFFISFATIKTFVESDIVCLIFGILVFAICWKIAFPKGMKSWQKKYISLNEHKHIKKCIFTFETSENTAILAFFQQLFEKSFNVELVDNFLILDNKLLVAFDYVSQFSQKRFVLDAYIKANKLELTEIAIFTDQKNADTILYANNLPNSSVYFFDYTDAYTIMKKYNLFITPANAPHKQKLFAGLKSMSLSKKKARSFLFTSFLLYFASLFIPFTGYYLIFAAISLILSIICFAMTDKTETPAKSYILSKENN